MTDNKVDYSAFHSNRKPGHGQPAQVTRDASDNSLRKEQVRLFVTALNIAAAGLAVGVALTIPLALLTTLHISGPDEILIEIVYAASAVLVHGGAQFILWRFG